MARTSCTFRCRAFSGGTSKGFQGFLFQRPCLHSPPAIGVQLSRAPMVLNHSHLSTKWWCQTFLYFHPLMMRTYFFNPVVQPLPSVYGTVCGRNPAPVDMVKHPIIYKVFYIPGGARFLPSTVLSPQAKTQFPTKGVSSWRYA